MQTKTKTFDCVEMMHRGALRIYEDTKDMTMEEELAYWRQRGQEARMLLENKGRTQEAEPVSR